MINQYDFWYVDINSRNIKDDLKIFSFALLKILLANQIVEFLKQLYLEKDKANQRDILYVDGDSRKINVDLRNFSKVGSQMLWVNQVCRFINNLYVEMESKSQCNFLAWRPTINVMNEVTKHVSVAFKLLSLIMVQYVQFDLRWSSHVYCYLFLIVLIFFFQRIFMF